jgi:hypothetical protein
MRGGKPNKSFPPRTPLFKNLYEKEKLCFHKNNAKLQNKTIHLKIESRPHAIFVFTAQNRRSHGTLGGLLNAAWSPT